MSSRIKDTSWPISLSIFTFFLSDKPEKLCWLLSKSNPPKPSHILWNDEKLAPLPHLDAQHLKWIICVGFETLWLFFVVVVRGIKMNCVSRKPHSCRAPSVIIFGVDHVVCFGRWYISKLETGRGLILSTHTVGLLFVENSLSESSY